MKKMSDKKAKTIVCVGMIAMVGIAAPGLSIVAGLAITGVGLVGCVAALLKPSNDTKEGDK